jgi:alkyl hydroperoxide reductase subunit AhpC
LGGIGKIKFPLLADFRKEASEAYDVLADDGASHRGLFLIDKHLRENTYSISIFTSEHFFTLCLAWSTRLL